jgi:hypothetical protein
MTDRVRARVWTCAAVVIATAGVTGRTGSARPAQNSVQDVVEPLARAARDMPLHVMVVAGWTGATPAQKLRVWVIGEIGDGEDWAAGGSADVALLDAAGARLSVADARVEPGTRTFRVALAPGDPLAPGEYIIRVRARSESPLAIPPAAAVHFVLGAAPQSSGAVLIRRGPVTANKEIPTADPRFRHGERLRVEVPAVGAVGLAARLLDRNGKPLPIPVEVAVRDDGDDGVWQTAQLALVPLAPGDYVIELTGGAGGEQRRTLVAFRVVP